ncbi:sulfatase-like hydrolase/transferase [Halosimplex rubrum]|uniref:Sulfatase-like hydrolase/transferase n=1 Tax=Halosimplex rubrum TaxID=869889 RepID=A0A7D5P723_9EURY|nr:sulfatase-like hydrolase/transferase [Halosimplex rubrum]QLH78918.1 sulfatase-like hydrolase/transferase [Halosimplex rubrum]
MTRNVVFVVLDSVRKDYFDEHAPRLLAEADVSISQCRAASNWSPPSHGAIFTGELPSVSGIHSHDPSYEDTPLEDTFLSAFRDHFRFAVSNNLFVARPYGFDEYFDEFANVSRHSVFAEGEEIDSFLHDIDATGLPRYAEFFKRALAHDETLKSAANGLALKTNEYLANTPLPRLWDFGTRTTLGYAEQLVRENSEPFFGFMNLMETHNPHANNVFYGADDVPNDWSSDAYRTIDFNNQVRAEGVDETHVEHYRNVYAESIRYTDEQLVAFVDRLADITDHETTVVVTADHGENLCGPEEDDLLGHVGNLSEALLHVPLTILNAPGSVDEPDDEYFSQLDLGTLIAGLADDELNATFRERVPAEAVGAAPPEDVADYDFWDRMIRAVYSGDRKYVWDSFGDRAVYRLDRDRLCTQTEVDEPWDDEAVAGLFETDIGTYKGQFGDDNGKAWSDDAPTERLKDLGYL